MLGWGPNNDDVFRFEICRWFVINDIIVDAVDATKRQMKPSFPVVESQTAAARCPATPGPGDAEAFSQSPLCQMILSRAPLSRTACGWPGIIGGLMQVRGWEVVWSRLQTFQSNGLSFKTVGSLAPKLDKQSVSSILTHFPWTQRFELVFLHATDQR